MNVIKIGINGFGRIGRLVFRAAQQYENIQVVGINDLISVDHMAYLLTYDIVHGRFNGSVDIEDGNLVVNGQTIRITSENDPEALKWNEIAAAYIIEATGVFLTQESARAHINAGVKRVVMSGPPKDDTPMFVMGVNEHTYDQLCCPVGEGNK